MATSGDDDRHQEMYKNSGKTLNTQRMMREDSAVKLRKKKRDKFFAARRAHIEELPSINGIDKYQGYSLYDDTVTNGLKSTDVESITLALMVHVANLKSDYKKTISEFIDLAPFGNIYRLYQIVEGAENGSNLQFLGLRVLSQVVEDEGIAGMVEEFTQVPQLLITGLRNLPEQSLGDALNILVRTLPTSTLLQRQETIDAVIDKATRICRESAVAYIRAQAALLVYKTVDAVIDEDNDIHVPAKAVIDLAADLVVSDDAVCRISGYAMLNCLFASYDMGNLVVNSQCWHQAVARCDAIDDVEAEEAFLLLENLASFMLAHELEESCLVTKMWAMVDAPVFRGSQKQLMALKVLTEIVLSCTDKKQLFIDSATNAKDSLVRLLNDGSFDVRRQTVLVLHGLLCTMSDLIPQFIDKDMLIGLSDMLTVMHADTVHSTLEILQAVFTHGGSPATGPDRYTPFTELAKEVNMPDRLEFLTMSPNDLIALLAVELLHLHLVEDNDVGALPDDLADIEIESFDLPG